MVFKSDLIHAKNEQLVCISTKNYSLKNHGTQKPPTKIYDLSSDVLNITELNT